MTEYQDNSRKYEDLRLKHSTFIYENYTISQEAEGIKVQFFFSCDEHHFSPYQLFYNKDFISTTFDENKQKLIENIAFHIGLIELISYWKAFCCPNILIKCGSLTESQQRFWKKLWFNGLGEFFYLNNIKANADTFVKIHNGDNSKLVSHTNKLVLNISEIVSHTNFTIPRPVNLETNDEFLVPIGGGKDSVVTLELLRAKSKKITPLVINSRGATKDCIERGAFSSAQTLEIKRTIDKHLLELNALGYLNGHTPFSAMLAFSCLMCSAITNKKYIALSNENSANEATDTLSGVNHQYSKSLEFENDFREYYKQNICPDIEYFSFLRPISELKIARIFSCLDYFDVFKSCNVGSKQDIWCGNCPKCLFAFIILSPFLNIDQLTEIFGNNLFANDKLKNYFQELIGEKAVKPFECVGTKQEVNMALCEHIRKYGITQDETLLQYYTTTDLYAKYTKEDFKKFLNQPLSQNNLPADLLDCFDKFYPLTKKALLAKHLANQNIAIVGLGREGLSTLRLLNKLIPQQFYLFDADKDRFAQISEDVKGHKTFYRTEDLATISEECSTIILTPGMAPKDYPQLDFNKLTNQCDLFLRLFHNQTIGVSGTKGKSTTSSLVYHILKSQDANTLLAGNIGIPFFDIIDSIDAETKIVLELSCHQLQLVKASCHISVLLNLFEEHLDHYTSFTDYQNAKLNLLFKAGKGDYFIYNSDDKILSQRLNSSLTENCKANQINLIGFGLNDYTFAHSQYLVGTHNKYNILAAMNVAKILNIPASTAEASMLDFKGLNHRMQFIGEKNGVKYYDDSISTIPQATLAAVRTLKNVSILILGGMDRGIDYSPIKELLSEKSIKHIVIVGKAGKRMYDILNNDNQSNITYFVSNDWNDIATYCKANAEPDTSVLLSPAATSYDQFKNFEHRGDTFKELIFG